MKTKLPPSQEITTAMAQDELAECPGCSGDLTRNHARAILELPGSFICVRCGGSVAMVEEADLPKIVDLSAFSGLTTETYFDVMYRRAVDGRWDRVHGWMDRGRRVTQVG